MLNANAIKLINALPKTGTVTSTKVIDARAGVLSTYIAEEMDGINGPDFPWDVDTVRIMVVNCKLAHEEL
jgi:hypothetical protein